MVASTVDDMTSIQQTRTVAQKMGVKPGLRAYLRDAPAAAVGDGRYLTSTFLRR